MAPASYSACEAIFELPATCAMRRKSSTAPAASPDFCLASAWRYTDEAMRSVRSVRILSFGGSRSRAAM